MSASATSASSWLRQARRPPAPSAHAVLMAVLILALALGSGGSSGISLPAGSAAAANGPAAATMSESAAFQSDAHQLEARYAGNPAALREVGRTALATGRNEATIAGFLRLRWVARLDAGLERYGASLAVSDPAQLALAVAGLAHYSAEIHRGLLYDGPSRLIIVSVQGQRLVAYDNGRTVLDTPVTTGRPSLPTDIGAMRVLRKDAPWTMQSPWPKGSPEWYPDTPVQMVLWFTANGEGLHDASWQPDSTLGPGSQSGPFASHGCIHLTLAAVRTLFDWAPLGAPVVVYPGDGSPLAVQETQQSVDAAGNPVSGVRGA
ncbi:MAG: L,D-transpeptidase [Chloroflexi bacterium]|nr:MAG: L,D-transpeptidase [Chloroflexota bacterium]